MHSPRVHVLDRATIGPGPARNAAVDSGTTSGSVKERAEITIFMTTHYMDEAEWCDRIAIMDHGEMWRWIRRQGAERRPSGKDGSLSTPTTTMRRSPRWRASSESMATTSEGAVTFGVVAGEQFVPRAVAEVRAADSAAAQRVAAHPRRRVHSYTAPPSVDAKEDQSKLRQSRDDADDEREAGR